MHKKVQSLIITGIMLTNTFACAGSAFADSNLETTNNVKLEKTEENEESSSKEVVPEDEWQKTTRANLAQLWEYDEPEDGDTIILKKYKNTNKKVEIPRKIGDKKVELSGLNSGMFPNVTHIRVAKDNNNKVKVRSDSLYAAFYKNNNIISLDLEGLDISEVTNFQHGFDYCDNLKYVNFSGIIFSKSANLGSMIKYNPKLETIDFSNVSIAENVNLSQMFQQDGNLKNVSCKGMKKSEFEHLMGYLKGASSTNITLDISNLNLENTTSLKNLFQGCQCLTSIKGLETIDTSSITDMSSMFNGCTNLTSIEGMETWKTNSLENMQDMFERCQSLTDMTAIKNWNTSNVTMMNGVFNGCSSLTSLDLSKWNTEKVTNLNGTFLNCTNLETIKFGKNWKINKVTQMNNTFNNCQKLHFIDLTGWRTESNLEMNDTFKTSESIEDRTLLVVTDDERITNYSFEQSGRTHVVTTFNANGGHFADNSSTETKQVTNNFTITPEEAKIIDQTIKSKVYAPQRDGYTFVKWVPNNKEAKTAFDKLNTTYTAVWKDEQGNIKIPGVDGGITIKPSPDGQALTIDSEGNITIPGGGSIELPNDVGNITIPGGGTVNQNGSIILPEEGATVEFQNGESVQLPSNVVINTDNGSIELENGGNITLPNSGVTVTVPEGTTVKPNGTIQVPNSETTINQNGEIIISGENGENITIPPMQNGQIPTIDIEGNVTIPGGGSIKLPNDIGTITIQGVGTVNKDGSITVPTEGGTIELPIGTIELPSGSTVKPNGSVEFPNSDVIINPDGEITLSVESVETITIPPVRNEDGNVVLPEINENGDITLPNGGTIELANIDVVVPNGSIINQNGTITVPNKGEVTLPNYETPIEVPSGTTINPDGSVIIPNGGNITISGKDNNNITINSGTKGQAPTIDPEGNITIPDGGSIELPSGTITPPNGSIMKPNGSIQTPNINNNGGIVITPEGNMKVSGGATVKPSEGGKLPQINEEGNVVVPEGGQVILPEDAGIVIVPVGSIVKPNGSIIVTNEGKVKLPSGETVTVKSGTIINQDGTINEEESKPAINDKIDESVVEIIGDGDGQENNPLVLSVKEDVTSSKLNTFLNGLNDLNPKVTSILRGKDYTEYKLEVNNTNMSVNRILKIRSTSKTTHATIKVENTKTDLVKTLNKYSRGTNNTIAIPSIVTFKDVSNKFWAITNIEDFASMGIVNGYNDGTFKPNNSITRAEFVKIINSAFGYTQKGEVKFSDVKAKDWFYNEVAIAVKAGYINGKSANTFAPNDKITRQEVAKILTTIMKNKNTDYDELKKFPDGTKVSDWAKPYVEGAIKAGYLSGDTQGKLNPTNNITRAEAVTVLSRIKK